MNAAELLAAARQILDHPVAATAGVWPRAVALLTRQALEKTLDEFWENSPATAELSRCPRRSQFTCLPSYMDAVTAREIAYIWSALSEACHIHAYELAPTATELNGWIRAVARLQGVLHDKAPSSSVVAPDQV